MNLRVQRGAALLDSVCPGWEHRISLDELDMRWSACCVIGQLYGSYDNRRGLALLGLKLDEGYRHGFITWSGCFYKSRAIKWLARLVETGFEELTSLWRHEILIRRSCAKSQEDGFARCFEASQTPELACAH